MAKVLVIGSGGREHALAWKLSQSPKIDKIYVAPGNGGTAAIAENVAIAFNDVDALLKFAKDNSIDLTVIGQEAASAAGVVDAFKAEGLSIFGPTKTATQIESSKVFSKNLMRSEHIPTAEYKTFNSSDSATRYLKNIHYPIVIKADGLAEGKGVVICENFEQAQATIQEIMVNKKFGDSGNEIVIEDFLKGQEVSIHALCDGKNTVIFPASQDHKQVFDGDKGPNTGGMGVIAPLSWVTDDHLNAIEDQIVKPALSGMRKAGTPFVGCLYPGLMIEDNKVNVVEFNSRFGDPEAEAYMRLLDGDLFEILSACVHGELDKVKIAWRPGFVAVVALASRGYPGSYDKDLPISGIEGAVKKEDIVVFHAGTKKDSDSLKTSGGRVLYVSATGDTLDNAIEKAYDAVRLINFDGMHYRTDIGFRQTP